MAQPQVYQLQSWHVIPRPAIGKSSAHVVVVLYGSWQGWTKRYTMRESHNLPYDGLTVQHDAKEFVRRAMERSVYQWRGRP